MANPKLIHDYLRATFDETIGAWEDTTPAYQATFTDLVNTIESKGATLGNFREEAIAEGLKEIADIQVETGAEASAIGVAKGWRNSKSGEEVISDAKPKGRGWEEVPIIAESELPDDMSDEDKTQWLASAVEAEGALYGLQPVANES